MLSSISDIVSLLALTLSAYATKQTVLFNKRQKSLIESQEKLNTILLEKEEHESINNKMAEITAAIVPIGNKVKKT